MTTSNWGFWVFFVWFFVFLRQTRHKHFLIDQECDVYNYPWSAYMHIHNREKTEIILERGRLLFFLSVQSCEDISEKLWPKYSSGSRSHVQSENSRLIKIKDYRTTFIICSAVLKTTETWTCDHKFISNLFPNYCKCTLAFFPPNWK